MSLTIAAPTRLEALQYASESLSSQVSNIGGKLLKLMPEIVTGFFTVKDDLAAPKEALPKLREAKLRGNQEDFLRITRDIPYSELRELRAYVPAGLSTTYLDAFGALLPATEYIMAIRGQVIEPYMHLLGQLVSDQNSTLSTKDYSKIFQKAQATRKAVMGNLDGCFVRGDKNETTVRHVIGRNADWPAVLQANNTVVANLDAIDLPGIERQLQQCSDYLTILFERLKEGGMANASPEVANGLSEGAYNVALEMQMLAAVYFRALQMSQSVESTVAHITECMG